MAEYTPSPEAIDYASLGLVANPFPPAAALQGESPWLQPVVRAASNRLLTAARRARERRVPVLVTTAGEIPEYYRRLVENDVLGRTAAEPEHGMIALNIPLDMMRLGRIRGTLAELSELAVAVDFPATIAAFLRASLDTPDATLPEAALITADELAEAKRLFSERPHEAVTRYIGSESANLPDADIDVLIHEAYLRQVGQPVEVAQEEETGEVDPAAPVAVISTVVDAGQSDDAVAADADPDAGVREYLMALLSTRLSPVIARGVSAFGKYGPGVAAQEIKVTKAPRKTLAALMRLLNPRWPNIVVMYDNFAAWPMLDQKSRTDVLASLMELRYLVAESGVVVIVAQAGFTPEIEEQFAAAEQVDWRLAEIDGLYSGERSFNAELVQSWLDAAAISGHSVIHAESPEVRRLVDASGDDLVTFAGIAEAAIRDAASRGAFELDEAAIDAGIAAGASGSGA